MNKLLLIVSVLFLLGLGLLVFFPNYECSETAQENFLLNKPFAEIRQYVAVGGFNQEIITANNIKVLKQEIRNSSLRIHKPLSPERDWEGTQEIYVEALANTDYGEVHVSIIQTITIGKNIINVKTKLDKPLSVGVTELNQEINIEPNQNQTKIHISCKMTVKRKVPKALQQTVKEQISLATQKTVRDIKSLLQNPKKGILIPLN